MANIGYILIGVRVATPRLATMPRLATSGVNRIATGKLVALDAAVNKSVLDCNKLASIVRPKIFASPNS